METILEAKEWRVKGHTYYRLLLPKNISDKLALSTGSKLKIRILQVTHPNPKVIQQPLGVPT